MGRSQRDKKKEDEEFEKFRLTTIADRWKICGNALGAGGFGRVYLVKDVNTGDLLAVKAQLLDRKPGLLQFEYRIYHWLHSQDRLAIGIPRVRFLGNTPTHEVMIMDLCGPTLGSLLSICPGSRMSLKTVAMIAVQALFRIQHVHQCSFLHRDIKPENMAMGRKDKSTLYFLDFGLAKRYQDHKSGEHLPYHKDKGFTGTVKFATLRTHMGVEQSRRDDIESLGYMLVYLFQGRLPWKTRDKELSPKEKRAKVFQQKRDISMTKLCEGMPVVFAEFIRYARQMGFHERPDYKLWRMKFRKVLSDNQLKNDGVFDWTKLSDEAGVPTIYKMATVSGNDLCPRI